MCVEAATLISWNTAMPLRKIGLEQEFFVVNPAGEPSQRSDELVAQCRILAQERGLATDNFETEWVKNILEINTPPAESLDALEQSYFQILQVAIEAAHQIDVRLYPYSVYPLHLIPVIRDEVAYHLQVRTVGLERFLNAGKCTGTHMHLEVPAGVICPEVGVSYESKREDRLELLNLYNLATALDPALISLSRASPFYEGKSTGLAHRTARYRGNLTYGWDGVYTHLPAVGGLRPYATSIEHLVQLQFERHYHWLEALTTASVEQELFFESGGNLLTSSWNPVRLNNHGTVELRNMDSNLPNVVLGLTRLIDQLRIRVIEEGLTVTPTKDQMTFEVNDGQLLVPDFELLESKLLFAAVSEGLRSSMVADYTRSVIEAAGANLSADDLDANTPLSPDFRSTESRLLETYFPTEETLSQEVGLRLVRDACDELERQVAERQTSVITSNPSQP